MLGTSIENLLKFTLWGFLLIAVIILYYLELYSYIFLVIFALVGISFSILFRSTRIDLVHQIHLVPGLHLNTKYFTISYFILTSLMFLSLMQGTYTKTTLFYFLLSLCVGLLGLEIAILRTNSLFILSKIYILCLSLFLSNQIIYPLGIGGADSPTHFSTIKGILDTGFIMPDYVYSFIPNHHLLIAVTSIISSLDFRELYYLVSPFSMSIYILILYFIGALFVSRMFGLICALIYLICDYILYWSSHAAQLAYYIPLMCLLYGILLIRKAQRRNFGYSLLSIILIISLIFTHHYSSVILTLLLFSFVFMDIIERAMQEANTKKIKIKNDYIILFIFLLVALFAHWIFYSSLINTFSSNLSQYISAIISLSNNDPTSISSSTRYDKLPIYQIFLNTIGAGLLIMLASYGFFNVRDSYIQGMARFWMIVTSMLIGIGILIELKYLLPNRIYVFLQLFSIIFLAGDTLTMLVKKREMRSLLVYLSLLMLITFFSSASTISGFETSIFVGDQPYVKLFETPQELDAEVWEEYYSPSDLTMYVSGSIYPSSPYSAYSKVSSHQIRRIPLSNSKNIINLSEVNNKSLILFSNYDIDIGFPTAGGTGALGSSSLLKLNTSQIKNFDCFLNLGSVYNNGIMRIYYRD